MLEMTWGGLLETHVEAVKAEGRDKEVLEVSNGRAETAEGVLRGMGVTVCRHVMIIRRKRSGVRLARQTSIILPCGHGV